MSTIRIRDDAIWIKHIDGNDPLRQRILALKAGESVDLEIAGIVGKWERMRDGKDGRPTAGIKPVSAMKEVWAKLRASKTGAIVDIREVCTADTYLTALASTLSEWDSEEDDRAYNGL